MSCKSSDVVFIRSLLSIVCTQLREPESYFQKRSCDTNYHINMIGDPFFSIPQVASSHSIPSPPLISFSSHTTNYFDSHRHHYHSHQQSLPLIWQFRLHKGPSVREWRSLVRNGIGLISPRIPALTGITVLILCRSASGKLYSASPCPLPIAITSIPYQPTYTLFFSSFCQSVCVYLGFGA